MVPGPDTVVTSPDGTTTFVGLSLSIAGLAEWTPDTATPAPATAEWTSTEAEAAI
jgi:hypothetical protein